MPFFHDEALGMSEYEKVDAIYRMLRSQRRARRFSLFLKLLVIGILLYGYSYLSTPAHTAIKQKIVSDIQTQFSEFIAPIVANSVKSTVGNVS